MTKDKKKSKKSILESKQANRKNSKEKVSAPKKTSKRSNQEKPRGKQSKGGGKGKTSQKQKAALLPTDAPKPDILPPHLQQNPPSIESKTPSKESSLAPAFDAVRPPSIATKKREPCVPIEPIVLQPYSLNPVDPPPWANVQKVMSDAKQSKPPNKAPPKETPEKEAPKKEAPEVRPRKSGSKDGKAADKEQDAKKADVKAEAKQDGKDVKSDGKAAQSQTKSNEPTKESSSNEENKKTAEKAADDDKRRADENEKKPPISPGSGSEQTPGGIEIGTLPKVAEADTPTVFEKIACSPRPFASPMKKDGVPAPVEAGKAETADGKDPKSPKEEPPKDDPPVLSTYMPTLPAYNIPDQFQY